MKEMVVAASIIVGGMLFWIYLHREKPARFRRKPLLTGGELDFFFRLREALPECIICPQIPASVLIEPTGVGPTRQRAQARLEARRVGYAVYDEDMQLLAVVEYDHRSRVKRSDVARDAWFSSAGIRTVRFPARRIPSEGQIRSRIFARQDSRIRSPYLDYRPEKGIDYQPLKTPWRNTANVHL
jgi:hypothetical protein